MLRIEGRIIWLTIGAVIAIAAIVVTAKIVNSGSDSVFLSAQERQRWHAYCTDHAHHVREADGSISGFLPPVHELCREEFGILMPTAPTDGMMYEQPELWYDLIHEPVLRRVWERYLHSRPQRVTETLHY